MSSTIPFFTPCAGVIPTPKTRRSSSGVTSATRVHTLLLPTSIAARNLSFIPVASCTSLEGRTVLESQVKDVANHCLAPQLSLDRLPHGELVIHVLTIADYYAITRISRQRQSLIGRVFE